MSYKVITKIKNNSISKFFRRCVVIYHVLGFSDTTLLSDLYYKYMSIYINNLNNHNDQLLTVTHEREINITDFSIVVNVNDPLLFSINDIAHKYDNELHLINLLSNNPKVINPLTESEDMFNPDISEFTDHKLRYKLLRYISKHGISPVVIVIDDLNNSNSNAGSMIHQLEKESISYFAYDCSTKQHIYVPNIPKFDTDTNKYISHENFSIRHYDITKLMNTNK